MAGEKIEGLPITEIVMGGVADNGQIVHFDVKFEDGEVVKFLCPYQRFGHILTSLGALVDLAAKEREKHGTDKAEYSEPFKIKEFRVGPGFSEKGAAIILQCRTQQNISIDLAFSPEQATGLIQVLSKALAEIQSGNPNKPN